MAMTLGIEGARRVDHFVVPLKCLELVTNKSDPLYHERAEWEPSVKLVRSIKRRGIRKPILVERRGKKLAIADGRMRYKAALKANEELRAEGAEEAECVQAPVIVQRIEDEADAQELILEMNFHTQDSPMLLAKSLKRLVERRGSEAAVARNLGLTPQTIKNYLQLFECCPAVQRAVEQGRLSYSVAKEFADLEDRDAQERHLKQMLSDGATKGDAAIDSIRRARGVATRRALGRKVLERWRQAIDDADDPTGLVRIVIAVVLGDEAAKKCALPEGLREALKAAEVLAVAAAGRRSKGDRNEQVNASAS